MSNESDLPEGRPQNYACGQCEAKFASAGELQSHLAAAHEV